MRDLTLENPIRAIREMSHDMSGRKTVRLHNGRELSALQIQSEYLERARIRRPGGPRTRSARTDPRPLGTHAARGGVRRPLAGRAGSMGHQPATPDHEEVRREAQAAAGAPADRPAGPRVPRHQPPARPVLPAAEARPRRRCAPTPRSSRPRPGRRKTTRARLRGDFIQAPRRGAPPRLHRRLGRTSSSTTRPSAPSCARTPSPPWTRAWSGSSRA